MGRYTGILQSSVSGHKTDFVYVNALRVGDRILQLLCQFHGFGLAGGKRVDQLGQFVLSDIGLKLNAGQPCRAQQLGELLLRGAAFERHSIEEQLITRGAQKQTGFRIFRDCGA